MIESINSPTDVVAEMNNLHAVYLYIWAFERLMNYNTVNPVLSVPFKGL